ncbi:YfhO family protein [Lentilactobacillus raoultii]|uniref:YfhO family protein n=1 Tax=Lentilactobacillus raoultii TaxID=1987503 RepID=A0ABW3PFV3_9LACO|nr:YfhO family protein [Lentilactobacillus raoultii]
MMKSRRSALLLCFLVPVIITTGYFIFRHFAPFGSSSILTVDMGQQYVDFFAHYHDTLLHDPSGFLYSFAKGLGGDMFGTWSYYLMSPLNLLILFFPVSMLPSVLAIITILKYGLAGLSFGYFLEKKYQISDWPIIGFAVSYALMGWMVANQLNTLWIDAAILLPLIFLGLDQLIKTRSAKLYTVSFTAMLLINYYMGWMIAIFIVAYMLVFSLFKSLPESQISYGTILIKWLKASLLSGILSAWLLIPTFFSLLSSKTHYSKNEFRIRFEYNPLDILGKFVNGSFDFKQLPSGTANVFVASIVITLFIYYYFSATIKPRIRIANLTITAFFVLSMCFQPLDLLWHGMQLPVWYPYRFSFIFSFWMLITAFEALLDILSNRLHWKGLFGSVAVVIIGMVYIGSRMKKLEYLHPGNYVWGWVYLLLSIGLIFFYGFYRKNKLLSIAIAILMTGEMSLNFVNSLNNISYLNNSDYTKFAGVTRPLVNKIKQRDHGFYRTGQTFSRTKNDALTADFNGGSIFSSTLESATSNFFGNIGQPNGDAYVFYSNGTIFTDSLLSMKYWLNERPVTIKTNQKTMPQFLSTLTSKPDLSKYQLLSQTKLTNTYQNPYALPIGFASPEKPLKVTGVPNNPVTYQNQLAKQLDPQIGQLFEPASYQDISYHNIYPVMNLDNAVLRKKNMMAQSYVTIKVPIEKNTSYYMTMGPNISNTQLSVLVNGNNLVQFRPAKKTVVANIATGGTANDTITVKFYANANDVWLQNVKLYKVNDDKMTDFSQTLNRSPFKVTHWNNHQLSGNINVKSVHQSLTTTIPYSKGWHVQVDHHAVKPKKWAKMFIYLPISKGSHHVTFTYWPEGLGTGLIISGIGLILIVGEFYYKKRKRSSR